MLRYVILFFKGGARFSELEGSRSSGCRFTVATPQPPFIHPKSSDLRESHTSSCWRHGGSGPLPPDVREFLSPERLRLTDGENCRSAL